MKELIIRRAYIFLFLFFFSDHTLIFTQEILEKKLEKNMERMKIENYFLLGETMKEYSIIFIYCNGGYYPLHNTTLNCINIGYKRYFLDKPIKTTGKKISTQIADEKLAFAEFKDRYLIKKDGENYYNVSEIIKHDLFASIENINSILFAAQYNYDFLILCEDGDINLYLPDNYPREALINSIEN
jgi:hypothetical protein